MFFVRAKDVAGARQAGCAGKGLAAKVPSYLGQGRLWACRESPPHVRHWKLMTHGHLGGNSSAISGKLHSTTAPTPAQAPLIAIVGLAAGWQNPASQTPRASARRPGSGIRSQRLQLARVGCGMAARGQRGADVVSWTPRLPSLGGEGLGRLLASHLRGSFWAPSSVRPS